LREEEEIKAVIGKPKGKDTTEGQSCLFGRDALSMEEVVELF
jgi:hypothetical protein